MKNHTQINGRFDELEAADISTLTRSIGPETNWPMAVEDFPTTLFEDPDDGARVLFHVVIGIDENRADWSAICAAEEDCKTRITRLCGGVTCWEAEGTWTSRAQGNDFRGPIERDVNINFLISLPVSECAVLWPQIRTAICTAIRTHKLPCDHIHAMALPAQSQVFCVSAFAAPVGH